MREELARESGFQDGPAFPLRNTKHDTTAYAYDAGYDTKQKTRVRKHKKKEEKKGNKKEEREQEEMNSGGEQKRLRREERILIRDITASNTNTGRRTG